MSPPLFLVPELGSGSVVELTGAEAHHAAVVMRLAPGEVVLLGDGRGAVARTEVLSADRATVRFTVLDRWHEPAPDPRLVVVQALPKGERAELAVQILTELGVDEIVPWSASRAVSVWRDDRAAKGVQKWSRVAWEASKQSRRARTPVVAALHDTAAVARRLSQASRAIVLHEAADQPFPAVDATATGEVIVVVGPEGGLSEEELAQFGGVGAVLARLGPAVMRTSTAGAAALAVLSARLGRWG